jgi:hypothetical protein
MPKFRWLRSLGSTGTAVANILAVLTANWPLVVSALAGLAAGSIAWLRDIALNPVTFVAATTFLIVLWTIIGICVLIDRRRPRVVRSHLDYRYGLTFEGLSPIYLSATANIIRAGSMQLNITVRNYTGFLARGASRSSKNVPFTADDLREFYGKPDTKGLAEFWITYGPIDGPPERRLKMTIEFFIALSEDGAQLGYADNIVEDEDEPIALFPKA